MPHRTPLTVFLIILSTILTGCSLSLPPPSPENLMTVFCEPFLCGFSCDGIGTDSLTASLVRTAEGDLLTVYGDNIHTVLFHDGAALYMKTQGNADIPPLTLALPDGICPNAAACLALFSVLPDERFSSARCDGGILVTNADGSYTAVFGEDGTPSRITYHGITAVITSFSAEVTPQP